LLSVDPNLAHYKPRTYSDRDIRIAIQNLFAGDPFLHRFGIKVLVKNGVAPLTGWVTLCLTAIGLKRTLTLPELPRWTIN
jgi:hypothetical protein